MIITAPSSLPAPPQVTQMKTPPHQNVPAPVPPTYQSLIPCVPEPFALSFQGGSSFRAVPGVPSFHPASLARNFIPALVMSLPVAPSWQHLMGPPTHHHLPVPMNSFGSRRRGGGSGPQQIRWQMRGTHSPAVTLGCQICAWLVQLPPVPPLPPPSLAPRRLGEALPKFDGKDSSSPCWVAKLKSRLALAGWGGCGNSPRSPFVTQTRSGFSKKSSSLHCPRPSCLASQVSGFPI